jgi:hypothetical protein
MSFLGSMVDASPLPGPKPDPHTSRPKQGGHIEIRESTIMADRYPQYPVNPAGGGGGGNKHDKKEERRDDKRDDMQDRRDDKRDDRKDRN